MPNPSPEPPWIDHDRLDAILARLKSARAVQLIGHVRPDGDCIGALLAMHHLLEAWGIAHALAAEKVPENGYGSLEGFDWIQSTADPALDPDLVVYLDCAHLDRGLTDWTPPAPIINIDHHESNAHYGAINWIESRCAATGEMMYYLIRRAGLDLTPRLAETLLVALATDTGSFRFSNTGAIQHEIAADLIRAGAHADRVTRIAFGPQAPQGIRLMGHALDSMQLVCDGRLAWSELRQDVYVREGGERMTPENLVDTLRNVQGVEAAILFHETAGGGLRVNLRSNGALRVNDLAARWGGGGHPCAAGCHLDKADYEVERDRMLRDAASAVDRARVD